MQCCEETVLDLGIHGFISSCAATTPKLLCALWRLACRHVRTRQLLQSVFAAAPGHPALKEVCDRIASSRRNTFSLDTHIDTLERTGPGVFTDVVLKHADLHAPHKASAGCGAGGVAGLAGCPPCSGASSSRKGLRDTRK